VGGAKSSISPLAAAFADHEEYEKGREEGRMKKAVAAAARPKLALWKRSVREAREERRVEGGEEEEEEEAFIERAVECLGKGRGGREGERG